MNAKGFIPWCEVCGENNATCIGEYESGESDEPRTACDNCCGHGNEDGYCHLLNTDEGKKLLKESTAQEVKS